MDARLKGKSFEELLIEKGFISKEVFRELSPRLMRERKTIDQLLIERGMPEDSIAALKAEYLGYPFVDVTKIALSSELLRHIKPAYAKNYKVLPLKCEGGVFTIAMVEPHDVLALDEVVRLYRGARYPIEKITVVMTSVSRLFAAIDRFYSGVSSAGTKKQEDGIVSILSQVEQRYRPLVEVARLAKEEATENSAPVVMLANRIVEDAFHKRSSDIHLEPTHDHLRVRYRIDGELTEVMRVPKYAQDALITRFKILCDMRIDERRQPQDGRIDFARQNPKLEIDLRVSSIPTQHGEDIVLRILDKKSPILSIDALGFSEYNLNIYREAIRAPYGILLHVGPTGSGKSTALYAALKTLDTSDVKICTAEDPVEYTLGGQIVQSNINPAAGYTFAKAIRAFMRHDPDIILIGEIRDLETAKTAVEASLTGHMVFSTLHTNDAIGTVTRLTEMGVEPYLVADSLVLVCAQRLVRKLCAKCKECYTVSDKEVEISHGDIPPGTTLFRGKGCPECDGAGFRGRVGIYELLLMNQPLRDLLIKGAGSDALRRAARERGMRTLRQDAIDKAVQGITSLSEVLSSTRADE